MEFEKTYSQMHIHIVFAVHRRQKLLDKDWRERAFQYISGIIEKAGQKSIIVNGVEDHVHILAGIRPTLAVSDLVREIKNKSSCFIKRELKQEHFSWQRGYGVFTYSKSQIPRVFEYIQNQERHHTKKNFEAEYNEILTRFGINTEESRRDDSMVDSKESP